MCLYRRQNKCGCTFFYLPIISFAYAVVEPIAMMVKLFDAFVAGATMFGFLLDGHFADLAIEVSNHVRIGGRFGELFGVTFVRDGFVTWINMRRVPLRDQKTTKIFSWISKAFARIM